MYMHYLEDKTLSPRGVRNALLVTLPAGTDTRAAERHLNSWYMALAATAKRESDIMWLPATGVAYTQANVDTARVRRILEQVITGLQGCARPAAMNHAPGTVGPTGVAKVARAKAE